MRIALAAGFFLLGLVTGCMHTATPQEFVYMVVASAPPGQSEAGWYSYYAGRDEKYQYLDIERSNFWRGPFVMMFSGPFSHEKMRCPVEQLPPSFPDGLKDAHSAYWKEWRYEEGRLTEFIKDYLSEVKNRPVPEKSDILP